MNRRSSATSPWFLIALGLSAAGCSAGPAEDATAITFDVRQPLLVVAPAATLAQVQSLDDAVVMWRARGLTALTTPSVPAAGADTAVASAPPETIEVQFKPAAPPFHGFYDGDTGVVYINDDLSERHARAVTIAHELGHAFGLVHVSAEARTSTMNPGNLTIEPTGPDRASLLPQWGDCAR